MDKSHKFGHRPPEISSQALGMGWISGVRRLEFSSAKSSQWHRHEETTLLGCLKGEVTYEFHGIRPITLIAGSFLIIPAHVEHRHIDEIDPVCKRIELLLDVTPRKRAFFSLFSPQVARTLHAELLKNALHPVKCTNDLQSAFAKLYDIAAKPPQSLSEIDTGYIRLLLTHILYAITYSSSREIKPTNSPITMTAIIEWLESHISEDIPIDRIVAKMGFSRTHVFTLFMKHTGLTPADYIKRLRVKKACEALKDPTATSRNIAERLGFSTASCFNAIFKRQTGLTPTQWRKKKTPQNSTASDIKRPRNVLNLRV